MLYDFGTLQKELSRWEDKAGRPAAVIGRSVCGRPLYGLWMGSGQETAVILAGFHGMEWITSAVLMDYAHIVCGFRRRFACSWFPWSILMAWKFLCTGLKRPVPMHRKCETYRPTHPLAGKCPGCGPQP